MASVNISVQDARPVGKHRQPLTIFRWRKDALGYVLSPDRLRIERRGGAMVEYDPAAIKLSLHRIFAGLAQSVLNPINPWGSGDMPEAYFDPNAPWGRRRFRDIESALLAFVSEFGFLGSDRSGADAEYETIDYLIQVENKLTSFVDAPWNAEKGPEEIFTEPFAGPNLRMYLGPDKAGRLQINYQPESLYAWLWLRAANDFSSSIRWDGPPCLYCEQTMGRGPRNEGAHRSDAKFCSDGCRVRFFRLSSAEQKRKRGAARARQRKQQEGWR